MELKVAEVIDCKKVKGADKLLQFRLDAGDETIVKFFQVLLNFIQIQLR